MKLFGCTMVKNEEEMIPYVMPYVERLGYDKFVVYDDSSTDNTVAELKKYPFVEIRTASQSTDMYTTDMIKANIESSFFTECWDYIHKHDGETVWMTFTDFDEVLYYSGQNNLKWWLDLTNGVDGCYFNKAFVQIIGKTISAHGGG